MAKINKYWGIVALGAATAAVAGAVAAAFAKRHALEEAADLEDENEEDLISMQRRNLTQYPGGKNEESSTGRWGRG